MKKEQVQKIDRAQELLEGVEKILEFSLRPLLAELGSLGVDVRLQTTAGPHWTGMPRNLQVEVIASIALPVKITCSDSSSVSAKS
jgi:hypothetical protein